MDNIKRLKTIVSTNINYIEPIKLKELAKGLKNSDKFPDISSSFEFPPKTIDMVINILFKKEYDKLNFFDIATLLSQFEQDKISNKVVNKFLFTTLLQELFDCNFNKKHIQNLILRIIASVLLNKKEHSFHADLSSNMNSKEFIFIKSCVKKDFQIIEKSIKNRSIKKELKYFGVYRVFNNLQNEYSNYILSNVSKMVINKDNSDCYINNLLYEDELNNFYFQLDTIIAIIEDNKSKNNNFLDLLIKKKLGDVEDETSNWYKLAIPSDLQERYKRLKGIFEFQRFVNIAEYLSEKLELKYSNISSNGNTNDATRLTNRSTFWSNYDEKFSSVKMWVSEDDFRLMLIDKPVDLKDIQQLDNINNEACVLEFKDANLLIIEFFRLKDGYTHYNSLIFENSKILKVKNMLELNPFNNGLYEELYDLSDYSIRHIFLWQGWVDEFLRRKSIYPNTSILEGKKFISPTQNMTYKKENGLEKTRREALTKDKIIRYEDVIVKTNLYKN